MIDFDVHPVELANRVEELEAELDAARSKLFDEMNKSIVRAKVQFETADAKLELAIGALEEAVYLLSPSQKDMEKRAGIYRIVNTLRQLKDQSSVDIFSLILKKKAASKTTSEE